MPKNKNNSVDSRTEETRVKLFPAASQDQWNIMSSEVEQEIAKRFAQGQSLLEICNYAKDERYRIAEELKHFTTENEFGIIREDSTVKADAFTPNYFAGGNGNIDALKKMKQIILEQQKEKYTQYNVTPQTRCNFAGLGQVEEIAVIKGDTLSPNLPTTLYYAPDEKHVGKNTYLEGVNVFMVVQENGANEDIYIRVNWPVMSLEIYEKKLNEFDDLRQGLLDPKCQGEEALLQLGFLAYDLSRMIPFKRGGAAVTGWIIRGIAQEKGLHLSKALKVAELPFDVCAMVQTNRDKYAVDFVNSIKKDFDMTFDKERSEKLNQIYEAVESKKQKLSEENRLDSFLLYDERKHDRYIKNLEQHQNDIDDLQFKPMHFAINEGHDKLVNHLKSMKIVMTEENAHHVKMYEMVKSLNNQMTRERGGDENPHFLIHYRITPSGEGEVYVLEGQDDGIPHSLNEQKTSIVKCLEKLGKNVKEEELVLQKVHVFSEDRFIRNPLFVGKNYSSTEFCSIKLDNLIATKSSKYDANVTYHYKKNAEEKSAEASKSASAEDEKSSLRFSKR